jgi:hypothetical protein
LTEKNRTVRRVAEVLAKEALLSETAFSAWPRWVKQELAVGRR